MRKLGSFLTIGLSLVMISAGANAATPNDELVVQATQRSAIGDEPIIVSYRDLALSTAQGHRALMRRLSFAIDAVCLPAGMGSSDPLYSLKCSNSAWDSARPQLSQLFAR